jgi:thiamine biosynthesis lipoprotein
MGADGPALDEAIAAVQRRFAREDARFSRFRGDSELSHVNRNAGRRTRISAPMTSVLRMALDAARRTDGRVDPTVLRALEAAGYDRDFDEVIAGARAQLHPAPPCGRWRDVRLSDGSVELPDGVGIDLGGVAKGWTVDVAVHDALATGVPWIVVNAGGDLRLGGDAPPLTVSIEDPARPDVTILRLGVDAGAIATSSTVKRAWGPDRHHLIDPRTARPSSTDVVQATAWAPTCADAEVAAKDAVLRGAEAVREIPSVVVTRAGDVLTSFAAQPTARDRRRSAA